MTNGETNMEISLRNIPLEDSDDQRPQGNGDSASEQYLAAIHALMMTMAKQNSIQIPTEALLVRPKVDQQGDDIRPRKAHFDSDKTISYQLEQRPTPKAWSPQEWDRIFKPFPAESLQVERFDDRANADLAKILSWHVPLPQKLSGAYAEYYELGYDEDGYVSKLRQGDLTAAAAMSRPVSRVIDEYMSTKRDPLGQRFGREWKLGLNGKFDHLLFSIAAAQLCRNSDLDESCGYKSLGSGRQRSVNRFLTEFRGEWGINRDLRGTSEHRWTERPGSGELIQEDIVFQYHMRAFATPQLPSAGVLDLTLMKREQGTLTNNKSAPSIYIREIRYSVGLKTTWDFEFPVFSLVTMVDAAAGSLQNCGELWERNKWTAVGIRPSMRATGIAAFAFRIHSLLPQWAGHWSSLVDNIQKQLTTNFSRLLSPKHRRETMVDTADLALLEFYFTVVQILRISAEWIQESMDDLQRMVDGMEQLYFASSSTAEGQAVNFLPEAPTAAGEAAANMFRKNWNGVILEQQRLGNALLARVAKIEEQTKSLRDDVFNATAVSEATKSTQLNRYVLVSTIATIFYLPLSFIAAPFALQIFDFESSSQKTWFIVTTSVVAGTTYLISWISIWAVGDPIRRRKLADAYARLDHKDFADWASVRIRRNRKASEAPGSVL
ncbi:hypothetical protein F5144DRAFT_655576 [Chaetomium tenue]|uniref:Uncharacterized protein n=1 Tax=Chaetomium tenue TaxID=1854479 RepID=A0ACB7P7M5_9PEZI|nr:hypothetical protein F5144DRAFT_655576 [Chaetomium globosum]